MEGLKDQRERAGSVSGPSQRVLEQREWSGSSALQKRRREDKESGDEMEIEQEEMPETVDQMRESLEEFQLKKQTRSVRMLVIIYSNSGGRWRRSVMKRLSRERMLSLKTES